MCVLFFFLSVGTLAILVLYLVLADVELLVDGFRNWPNLCAQFLFDLVQREPKQCHRQNSQHHIGQKTTEIIYNYQNYLQCSGSDTMWTTEVVYGSDVSGVCLIEFQLSPLPLPSSRVLGSSVNML